MKLLTFIDGKQTVTYNMPRFHQTVLPLEKMFKIWFKLSIIFAIVSFVETLIEMPALQEQHFKLYNSTLAYKNWSNTATCQATVTSQLMHEYPYLAEVMIISSAYFLLGSLRAMTNVILPYYFTTFVISLYA